MGTPQGYRKVTLIFLTSAITLALVFFPNATTGHASFDAINQISVISAPTRANPGERLTFTWTILWTGRITHTAVYWDTKPRNPEDYNSYAHSTLEYASINPPDLAPKRYTVSFSAPESGPIYWIIHAKVEGDDIYRLDRREGKIIIGVPENAAIDVKSVPATFSAGEKLSFVWEIKGTGKISQTAVYWDTESRNSADYKSYTHSTPEYAAIDPPNDAPHLYELKLEAPQASAIYYVIYAVVDGKNLYLGGGERVIQHASAGSAAVTKGDVTKKDSTDKQAETLGIDNATLMLVAGAGIVIAAIGAVALTRRKAKPA